MRRELWITAALWVIAVLLLMHFLQGLFTAGPARAVRNEGEVGRYQITSWAAHSGGTTHHSGYYVLDTVTGEVVDRVAEVHVRG